MTPSFLKSASIPKQKFKNKDKINISILLYKIDNNETT